ncbi:MAG: hypothetical protein WAV72_19055, partial [Bradyrhizobium sp.]
NGLFIERDGYIFPLPAQSKVWDEVTGKEVQTAIGILERRSSAEISKRKGNVTAFGMTMEPNIAGLIGPALEIVLLLYLLALASQLSSAPASDFDKVANFPEIAILRTGAGSLLIILSIFVLPICATITLIVTSFQDVTLRYGYIVLFSVCWLALSGQFLYKLWQVARMPKPMIEVQ